MAYESSSCGHLLAEVCRPAPCLPLPCLPVMIRDAVIEREPGPVAPMRCEEGSWLGPCDAGRASREAMGCACRWTERPTPVLTWSQRECVGMCTYPAIFFADSLRTLTNVRCAH